MVGRIVAAPVSREAVREFVENHGKKEHRQL
jgi:hypothetical protein